MTNKIYYQHNVDLNQDEFMILDFTDNKIVASFSSKNIKDEQDKFNDFLEKV